MVHLNSIGDPACRPAYVEELTAYYRGHRDELPELERGRLERNVLRLLDSNDPAMAALNAAAPKITDRLCDACADHFAGVRAHLDALDVPYPARARPRPRARLLHPDRVRVLRHRSGGPAAGDRWRAGGTTASSSCWVAGPRRGSASGSGSTGCSSRCPRPASRRPPEPSPVAVVVGADPDDTAGRLRVATDLRAAGIAARADLGRRKLGKQLESASRDQAHFAVILGDELAGGEVGLRDLPAGTQKVVAIGDLAREIERAHGAHRHGAGPD